MGTSFSLTETLSALLFNSCDNDLQSVFQNTLSDPIILPNGTKLNSLLYADHLIIISRSKIGLQNCLYTLSSFCNSWMLDINSKKTKVIIFQKRGKKNSNLEFHIGKETINIVHEYTYLFLKLLQYCNYIIIVMQIKLMLLLLLLSVLLAGMHFG